MLAFFFLAIPILISDWRYRRIHNIYMLLFLYWVMIMRVISGIASIKTIFFVLLIALSALLIMRIGMGDAKFFVIIALALNLPSAWSLALLIICIYLSAIAQIIIASAYYRRVPSSIPLAFAIFFGTVLYLAARNSPSLRQYSDALVNSW